MQNKAFSSLGSLTAARKNFSFLVVLQPKPGTAKASKATDPSLREPGLLRCSSSFLRKLNIFSQAVSSRFVDVELKLNDVILTELQVLQVKEAYPDSFYCNRLGSALSHSAQLAPLWRSHPRQMRMLALQHLRVVGDMPEDSAPEEVGDHKSPVPQITASSLLQLGSTVYDPTPHHPLQHRHELLSQLIEPKRLCLHQLPVAA